jgi:putative nucleotidyltransferase with HDIG domain
MRLPIRYKIILPFAVLLVFVGVIGSGVATARLTDAAAAKFDADLLHNSLLANQSVAQIEAARLADLRLATDTVGVPESLAANDLDGLAQLLTPVAANVTTARIQLRVLDFHGTELLHIEASRNGPSRVDVTNAAEFAAEPAVIQVLAGEHDAVAGDRRLFLSSDAQPMVYWTGAVRTPGQRIVGAVLVGESLTEIAGGIDRSAFYDGSGKLLASALANPPVATEEVRRQVTSQTTIRPLVDETHPGHAYWTLFSTWTMRGSQFGYLAVQANADSLLSTVKQVRVILTLVFTAAALLTLLVGSATASLLTRPIEGLVRSMRVVSAGNLQHRATIGSRDEIGYLAQAFNEMTASLEEKTAALEETTFASMEALARAIDARDPSTFGHSARVAAVSIEIADEMQLPVRERESLRRAALLHDIGKIGVQDRVLRKPGPLNDAEMSEMREHSRIGHDMLEGLRFLRPSLPGILHHHERWDGGGYPTGLTGTAIPLLVRIITVADVFDALTSDRPYRDGLSFEAATDAIRDDAGRKFDPQVVAAFMIRRPAIEALLRQMGKTMEAARQPEAA